MKKGIVKKSLIFGILLLFIGANMLPQTIATNNVDEVEDLQIAIQILENVVKIDYCINDFTTRQVNIDGENYVHVSIEDESHILTKGMPDLPYISRSIIIPDTKKMEIKVTNAKYELIKGISIIPSKGNLLRDVNPNDAPYEFDGIYQQDMWYPENIAELGEPYIIRDFRGQVVRINPFQYNPMHKTLRVYSDISIELSPVDSDDVNCLSRTSSLVEIDADFSLVYAHHFMNFDTVGVLYDPVEESSRMLIIIYDDFYDAMIPLLQWKNMKGIHTEMVNVSEIGDENAIKSYITNYYNTYGLTYVLLVGDVAQIPTLTANGKPSDPSYSYIVGEDHYPDIFVGRFSAETSQDVETQVERTIEYEKYPQEGADWYQKGMGVASGEGPGDDGEDDWQHIRNIRTDLLNYNYIQVDELYDGSRGEEDAPGSPSKGMVSAAIDEGCSIINYCGHGASNRWSTSGFYTSDIDNLVNDNMLPFIFSVGCNNGYFIGADPCFAEGWMRATNNGEPTGAIAVFMSSRAQLWDPPMDAQDEYIDILVESYENNKRTSFGGLAIHGCMHMNDEYPSSGPTETDAWHIFGDPSLQVRTDIPSELSVSHNSIFQIGSPFEVYVPGVEGASCALSQNFRFLGSAYTDETGHAIIELEEPVIGRDDLDLVVTGYNKIPYITNLTVDGGGPPETPDQPDGVTEGDANEIYVYSVQSVIDPEGMDVYYLFDWGDGLDTGWLGPYPSGYQEPIEAVHQWKENGYYEVKVRAKDSFGELSSFSEPLIVSIGQRFEITSVSGGLGFSASIENTLPTSKYCDYKIEVAGGSLPGFHVKQIASDTVFIESGSVEKISVKPFFALGRVQFRVTAKAAGEPKIEETFNGFCLFFLVIIR